MAGKRPGRRIEAQRGGSNSGEARADPRETLAAILARSFSGQRHCVQGAELAREDGDSELAAFFEHARHTYEDLAEGAGSLLAERMGGVMGRATGEGAARNRWNGGGRSADRPSTRAMRTRWTRPRGSRSRRVTHPRTTESGARATVPCRPPVASAIASRAQAA